jgi:hypothetical protein
VSDEMRSVLEGKAIRARRRPSAIIALWLWELAAAFLVAAPLHSWARYAVGTHPDGDAVLFRPRGHALLSWLGEDGPALSIVLRTSLLAIVVFAILAPIVTGFLVASLITEEESRRAPPLRWRVGIGIAAFLPIGGIAVLLTAAEGFLLGVGLLAAAGVNHGLTSTLGDQRAFVIHLVVVFFAAVLVAITGVFGDLAKVGVARAIAEDDVRGRPAASSGARMRTAALAALTAFRRHPGRILGGWTWRTAVGLALIVCGSKLGDLVGGRGGLALGALFFAHQAITLARAGLRTSWLAQALRSLSEASCTPARTAELPAPSPDPAA